MRRLVELTALVVCISSACGASQAAAPASPTLDRQTALGVASRADELASQALDGGGVADLASVFGGPALQQLQSRATTMAGRGFRLEERAVTRSLVSWDPRVPDAILQVEALDRLITPDAPDPAWAATERQVWSRFEHTAAGWQVVETRDLSPDRWLST